MHKCAVLCSLQKLGFSLNCTELHPCARILASVGTRKSTWLHADFGYMAAQNEAKGNIDRCVSELDLEVRRTGGQKANLTNLACLEFGLAQNAN